MRVILKNKISPLSFFLFSFFLTIYAPILNANAAEPIKVAIIDTPVDYSHDELSDVVDLAALQGISMFHDDGAEMSAYELNQKSLFDLKAHLNEGRYKNQIDFIEGIALLASGSDNFKKVTGSPEAMLARFKFTVGQFVRYLVSPSYRKEVKVIEKYLHGTHVAGLVVNSLNPAELRIINFPIIRTPIPPRLKLSEIWKFDPEKQRTETRRDIDAISKGLKETGVRIVNMSIETSYSTTYNELPTSAVI